MFMAGSMAVKDDEIATRRVFGVGELDVARRAESQAVTSVERVGLITFADLQTAVEHPDGLPQESVSRRRKLDAPASGQADLRELSGMVR